MAAVIARAAFFGGPDMSADRDSSLERAAGARFVPGALETLRARRATEAA
ncbi:MAG TPA: hypothetical protein VK820_01390 [Steroidobacteraceae bacterium]|jgi:hypothetical protein|nr:hypothetical protein [Steroidobacteraceae bacterium]